MKRILLISVVIFIMAGTMAFAQQTQQNPTSAQTRQSAQQYLTQSKSNNSDFQSTLDDLKARNGSNRDASAFARLKSEIDRIEVTINSEEKSIRASLDKGTKVNSEVMNRYENFINQHSAKVAELESFVSN
jgi:peptidoglycan hydrolase CwlO-like protein